MNDGTGVPPAPVLLAPVGVAIVRFTPEGMSTSLKVCNAVQQSKRVSRSAAVGSGSVLPFYPLCNQPSK